MNLLPMKLLLKDLLIEVIARVISNFVVDLDHNIEMCDRWVAVDFAFDLHNKKICGKRVSDFVVDLHNIKMCCKSFLNALEDNYVGNSQSTRLSNGCYCKGLMSLALALMMVINWEKITKASLLVSERWISY
ncbi:hypothetical protein VNO78_23634 [Psophocarpus tetragonolobus]|uniref:Uncharacterized protein n=1 Tax=Psophocarpus tetragonolobus TaxID=3891 RepID=A0AAN9S4H4_PSOTE